MNAFDLTATIRLTEGAELYASLLELTELTKQHAELSQQISELSDFIRKQVDVQMAKESRQE
jgi:hypothetical protein